MHRVAVDHLVGVDFLAGMKDLSFSKLVAAHVCLTWGPGVEPLVCEDTPEVNLQDDHVYAVVLKRDNAQACSALQV